MSRRISYSHLRQLDNIIILFNSINNFANLIRSNIIVIRRIM